ncbi:MAG: ribonuclease G [Gammaproteobacteria bacterium]|nr:ribonuclease G [Gammaproteobacteria bacterium]
MSEEILINVTPSETRVAILENGVLQEVQVERTSKRGLVGNVYLGSVSRVLPGMQAAFLDIGLQRTAFLHASNVDASINGLNTSAGGDGEGDITKLLHEGQKVLVRVIKDPLGTKGARLTTHISIPSRYLVFMPHSSGVGVSHKIECEAERQRLKEMLESAEGGYIVRTAAEGADDLEADRAFLNKLWQEMQEKAKTAQVGTVVYEDLPLAVRTMRDQVGAGIDKVRVDSRESHQRLLSFAQKFLPEMESRIEHYPGERPIFDLYSVEDEIQKALERKVQLKSGGHLVIDQTEALTTVDVNTGAFVGHRNLAETIFKTNLEAAQAIARQLRLRNLGGIIIIDFIDMEEETHKQLVLQELEKNLERSHARCSISGVSGLGLVEMTRKRTRESLEHVLCEQCPTCSGRGSVKTPETVCYEIFREIMREARQYEVKQYLVLASDQVVDLLLDEESTSVAELEQFIGKPVKFQAESLYTQEQFDIVLM